MPQLEISTFLPQIFWLIISFSTLYIIMWKIAVPKISNVLESRQKRTKDNLDKATKAKHEAEKTISAYEGSIIKARAEAQKEHNTSAKNLSDEIEVSEKEVMEELSGKIAESEAEIQDAINSAMGDIRKISIEVASEAIFRLTGQAPDAKELISATDRVTKAQAEERG